MVAVSQSEWPKEISDAYSPVRVIGKGGFASVWMAKKKSGATSVDNNNNDDDHVAVKLMKDDGYAEREIAILSELSMDYPHPNIIRWIFNCRTDTGMNCIVLSLARGPPLNAIISKNGALGLVIAQTISRQLIDVIAYLHGHAVIHRDVQPCNIIVSGSQISDELWWNDELDAEGKLAKMVTRCRITLIDFGFAIALSPSDIDVGLKKVQDESENPTSFEGSSGKNKKVFASIDEPLKDISSANNSKQSRGRGSTRTLDASGTSVSHLKVRDLSALGTRNYAAPEILQGIRNLLTSSTHSRKRDTTKDDTKKRECLAECVSSYGMTADAFSVGTTIRHMVLGVPPSEDSEEFIASQNNPLKQCFRRFTKSNKRAKVYRMGSDLPEEVENLIHIMCHFNPKRRATVRSVTSHPWIKVEGENVPQRQSSTTGSPIVYLECGKVI